jgi:hypothetical protein
MREHMDEEKMHQCPSCGESFPCDESHAEGDAEHLTEGEKAGLDGKRMDREGREEKHR